MWAAVTQIPWICLTVSLSLRFAGTFWGYCAFDVLCWKLTQSRCVGWHSSAFILNRRPLPELFWCYILCSIRLIYCRHHTRICFLERPAFLWITLVSVVDSSLYSKPVDKLRYSKTVDWIFQQASEPEMAGVSRQFTNPNQVTALQSFRSRLRRAALQRHMKMKNLNKKKSKQIYGCVIVALHYKLIDGAENHWLLIACN